MNTLEIQGTRKWIFQLLCVINNSNDRHSMHGRFMATGPNRYSSTIFSSGLFERKRKVPGGKGSEKGRSNRPIGRVTSYPNFLKGILQSRGLQNL